MAVSAPAFTTTLNVAAEFHFASIVQHVTCDPEMGRLGMPTALNLLADIDRRLDDAIVQLREQQAIVAVIDCEREDQAVLVSLLSSVLEQFYGQVFIDI
jgi:glucose-6-phosphate-specific signal transduction histidine kinase